MQKSSDYKKNMYWIKQQKWVYGVYKRKTFKGKHGHEVNE